MIWKATLVLSLALCVSSDRYSAISEQRVENFYTGHHGDLSHIGHHEPEHHEVYAWAYPSYEFSYHVDDPHTHDKKGQYEVRDGDKVTGNYWLIQPDGLKRTVNYHSDHKSGFHAKVNYLPHNGHHEVRSNYEKHGFEENYKEVPHIGFDRNHDIRRFDEHRDDIRDGWGRRDHDDHYDHKDNHHREHDYRRGESNEEHQSDRRDERRGGIDHPRHEGDFWGIHSWGKKHEGHREERKDEILGWRKDSGHEEHWKDGVLVGWTEGRGRDGRRGRDEDRRGHENNRGHEDRRRQHSYNAPILNFKPLVPYGQRLR